MQARLYFPMNIEKHVEHWRKGAEEDWEVAQDLLGIGRCRHALFFAHLAVEKVIKACVTKVTGQVPPKTHNLLRLAQVSALQTTSEQSGVLRRLNMHQLAGRYPGESSEMELSIEQAAELMKDAERILEWLKRKL